MRPRTTPLQPSPWVRSGVAFFSLTLSSPPAVLSFHLQMLLCLCLYHCMAHRPPGSMEACGNHPSLRRCHTRLPMVTCTPVTTPPPRLQDSIDPPCPDPAALEVSCPPRSPTLPGQPYGPWPYPHRVSLSTPHPQYSTTSVCIMFLLLHRSLPPSQCPRTSPNLCSYHPPPQNTATRDCRSKPGAPSKWTKYKTPGLVVGYLQLSHLRALGPVDARVPGTSKPA